MKLYAITNSDKGGREARKGGDEEIYTTYKNGNIPVFDVIFRDDGDKCGTLEIMSYRGGKESTTVIEY